MFAIPIFGLKNAASRPPIWLSVAALSGFLMTLLYVVLSLVPIIQVENRFSFALKIGGLIVGTNLTGFAVYKLAKRKTLAESDLA